MKTHPLFKKKPDTAESRTQVRLVVVDSMMPLYISKLTNFCKRYVAPEDLVVERTSNLSGTPYKKTICVGTAATNEVLGRKIQITSARRGYSWYEDSHGEHPVFWVPSPTSCKQNRFVGQSMIADFSHILETRVDCEYKNSTYNIVETIKDSQFALDRFRAGEWTAYDCETAGVMFGSYFDLIMLSATTSLGETYVWDLKSLRNKEIRNNLISFLEDPNYLKVGHNLKYDMLAPKAAWGIQVRGFYSDTQLKRKVLQSDALSGLELCSELVGMGGYKQEFEESLVKAKRMIRRERAANQDQVKFSFLEHPALDFIVKRRDLKPDNCAYALVPEYTLGLYCARDSFATYLLEKRLAHELENVPNLKHIWDSVVCKLVPGLERMESWGLLVDKNAMMEFEAYVKDELQRTKEKLQARGLKNPASSQEVSAFLFGELKLEVIKRSEKTNEPSTDVHVLKALEDEHEAVKELLEFRRLGKLVSAYGEKLQLHISRTGRIHPQLKPDGTKTGRLSCSNPGLHQIPRAESTEGKMIKNCFVAPQGHKLIQLDYSQLELRVAAMLAEDKVMIDMFNSGEDFHSQTAALVAPLMWGVPTENVRYGLIECSDEHPEYKKYKKYRSAAKQFNFGLLYGMTDKGMADRIGCTKKEATKLRQVIMGAWKGLAAWIKQREEQLEEFGCTTTWWNGKEARRRELWTIASKDRLEISQARNASINTPVQGTASDYCAASIGKVVADIDAGIIDAKLVLSVHDSIIIECKEELVEEVAAYVRDIMQGWESKGIPLKVDCEVGTKWGSLVALHV